MVRQDIPPFCCGVHPYTNTHCRNREDAIALTIDGDLSRTPIQDICPFLAGVFPSNVHAFFCRVAIAHYARKTGWMAKIAVADEAWIVSQYWTILIFFQH